MTYYVDAAAKADGNGTKENPFKKIGQAAAVAVAGDQVIVAPGVYREWVNPANGGTEDKRIVYKSAEPLGAHITGAEPLTGWTQYKGNVYTARVSNKLFGDFNPYTQVVSGALKICIKNGFVGVFILLSIPFIHRKLVVPRRNTNFACLNIFNFLHFVH